MFHCAFPLQIIAIYKKNIIHCKSLNHSESLNHHEKPQPLHLKFFNFPQKSLTPSENFSTSLK